MGCHSLEAVAVTAHRSNRAGLKPTRTDDIYGLVCASISSHRLGSLSAPQSGELLDRQILRLNPSISVELSGISSRAASPRPGNRYKSGGAGRVGHCAQSTTECPLCTYLSLSASTSPTCRLGRAVGPRKSGGLLCQTLVLDERVPDRHSGQRPCGTRRSNSGDAGRLLALTDWPKHWTVRSSVRRVSRSPSSGCSPRADRGPVCMTATWCGRRFGARRRRLWRARLVERGRSPATPSSPDSGGIDLIHGAAGRAGEA